jgi:hypothetical protein
MIGEAWAGSGADSDTRRDESRRRKWARHERSTPRPALSGAGSAYPAVIAKLFAFVLAGRTAEELYYLILREEP